MKPCFLASVCSALSAVGLWAAPAPIYINNIPVNASGVDVPIIDALAWVNQSIFNVLNDAGNPNPLPYRSQNTLFFTNVVGASMYAAPGFQFIQDQSGRKSWMDTWVNDGSIAADWALGGTFFSGGGFPETSLLSVQATNLFNAGPLSVGTKGTLRLEGKDVRVKRSGLRSGPPAPSALFGASYYLGGTAYYNDYGISDIYWGLGNGNVLQGGGNVNIDGPRGLRDPYFQMPCPQSPYAQVLQAPWMPDQFGFCGLPTNNVSLPDFTFCYLSGTNGYASLTYTNTPTPSNTIVQVVFYPTNAPDSTFSNTVVFDPWTADGRARVVVGFHNTEFDIVWRSNVTYSIYLLDNLMVAQSNVNYAANAGFDGLNRPNSYSISRGGPSDFSFGFYTYQTTDVFDPTLIYNANYTARAVPMFYTAYGARVDGYLAPSPAFRLPCATNSFVDSANFIGMASVTGDRVNLNRTRIRAESSVVVKSANLVNNQLGEVDAPFVNFDVGSSKPELTISNLAPATVRRINGKIQCWSGIWANRFTNSVTTNDFQFHVLFIDHNLRGVMPVTTDQFAAKAGSLVISDPLMIGKYFRADASNLTVTASGGVTLPPGTSVGATNFINVRNFTNHGFLSIPGAAHFGDDRFDTNGQVQPYLNFVNTGTIGGGTLSVKADQLFNSGLLSANGGAISLDTVRTRLLGGPTVVITNYETNYCDSSGFCYPFYPYPFPVAGFTTNVITTLLTNTSAAQISGSSVVAINARNLLASNSIIHAARLVVSVTNNLSAGDLGAPSTWITSGGFEMRKRPTNSSSLMAVTLLSQAVFPYQQVDHVWCARNLGAINEGFNNNLAVGQLILDGAENSIFRFSGKGPNKALYVDYLELRNYATNFFGGDRSLRVDPSITLYIANANVGPAKLTNSFSGRIRWVPTFLGPLSTTNLWCYCTNGAGGVTSNSYPMNIALASDMDIDSDGDGLANGVDPDPLGLCACTASGASAGDKALRSSEVNPETQRVGASTDLQAVLSAVGRLSIAVDGRASKPQVALSWDSVAEATNIVEISTSPLLTKWQTLTNFATGPTNGRLTVSDALSSPGQRFYRVRVLPPPE